LTPADSRAEFEAWIRSQHKADLMCMGCDYQYARDPLHRDPERSDVYHSWTIQQHWQTWDAAWQAARKGMVPESPEREEPKLERAIFPKTDQGRSA
jgi:hypothetical protein